MIKISDDLDEKETSEENATVQSDDVERRETRRVRRK